MMRYDEYGVAERAARRAFRCPPLAAAAVLAISLAGCDLNETLSVEDPDVVRPADLTDRSALLAVLNGALAQFQVAFVGSAGTATTPDDSQISLSGLMTDEFFDIETFPTRVEVDQRNIQTTNGTMLGIYRSLQRARVAADQAAGAFARLDSNTVGHSEVLSLSGYSSVLFAENYCSGVPFSRLSPDGELEYGAAQTSEQMLTVAVAKFDSAIAAGTKAGPAAASRVSLAQLGKARALLDLGRFAEAGAVADSVPVTFVYTINTSENSPRQNNGVFLLSSGFGRRYAGAKGEGINGLNFIDGDPRAISRRPTPSAVGFDGFSPAFYQQKYTSRTAPAVLADGIEARLIRAEAALQAGDATTLIATLNALRADPAVRTARNITAAPGAPDPLPPLADPGTPEARQNLLFQERAYWLWLTSHRLGDMRRLIRQYARDPETVFPTGAYPSLQPKGGGRYFTDVNFPIPFDEKNNPQFSPGQCLDRNA